MMSRCEVRKMLVLAGALENHRRRVINASPHLGLFARVEDIDLKRQVVFRGHPPRLPNNLTDRVGP